MLPLLRERAGVPDAPWRVRVMRWLASASASDASQAALLVEPGLLSLGSEEAAVSQFTQDPGSLHSRLEAFEKGFWVFALSQRYIGQITSPRVWITELGYTADDPSCGLR